MRARSHLGVMEINVDLFLSILITLFVVGALGGAILLLVLFVIEKRLEKKKKTEETPIQ